MVPPLFLAYLIFNIFAIQQCQAQFSQSPVLTQHILHPAHKDVLVPGSVSTIRWNANTHFKNVTLQLWDNTSWGYSHDLLTPCYPWGRNSFCGTIATHVPNTGSYDWTIPNPANGTLGFGFPRNETVFYVKIFVEDYIKEELGNRHPVVSWSQNFAFAADGQGGTVGDDAPTNSSTVPVYVTEHMHATATGSKGAPTTTGLTPTRTGARSGKATAKGEAVALGGGMWLPGALLVALSLV